MSQIWWCNQTRCWIDEYPAGLVCAAEARGPGGDKYRRMVNEVRAGDVTVHYLGKSTQRVVALSRALADARHARVEVPGATECWPEPEDGWMFEAEYYVLPEPIKRSAILPRVAKLGIEDGPAVGSSIRQGYFMRFSVEGLQIVRGAARGRWPDWAERALD